MVEKKSGCILNISSMNAYIPLAVIWQNLSMGI